jgi:hypothetical protein
VPGADSDRDLARIAVANHAVGDHRRLPRPEDEHAAAGRDGERADGEMPRVGRDLQFLDPDLVEQYLQAPAHRERGQLYFERSRRRLAREATDRPTPLASDPSPGSAAVVFAGMESGEVDDEGPGPVRRHRQHHRILECGGDTQARLGPRLVEPTAGRRVTPYEQVREAAPGQLARGIGLGAVERRLRQGQRAAEQYRHRMLGQRRRDAIQHTYRARLLGQPPVSARRQDVPPERRRRRRILDHRAREQHSRDRPSSR